MSASEGALAFLGVPIVLTQTVNGPLDLDALEAAVDDLFTLHPVLAGRIVLADGRFALRLDGSLPRPRLVRGGDLDQIGAPLQPDTPLLRVVVREQDEERHTLAFAVHHAISDGTSAFALGDTLWRGYTAHVTGVAPLLPPPTIGLPRPVEEHFRARFSDAELADFLAQRAAKVRDVTPVCLPTHAATHGVPGEENGIHIRQLRLTAEQSEQLLSAARATGISINMLVHGIALRAIHSQTDTPDEVRVMTCYSTIDLRRRIKPPLPPYQLVLAASAQETVVDVGPHDHPAAIGRHVWDQLKTAVRDGTVEKCIAALPQMADDMLNLPMSASVSNLLTRTPLLQLPPGLVSGPVEGWAIPSAPFPAVFLTGNEIGSAYALCITLNLSRGWFTAEQADGLAGAVERTVHDALRP
ncbi:MAG: hypothetical protein AUG49_00725 [Catenulispora sp. 13_1_20CM_3_70_7]|nr:MAG: hypothetical protein AUG49_00725 [Catenulispora sp. 13_1_20CM_3_70_7]